MKTHLNILSTSFSQEIKETEMEGCLQKGRDVIFSYGQKLNDDSTENRLVFSSRILQHFCYHPYYWTYNSSLESYRSKKGSLILKYKVNHPIPILCFLLLHLIIPIDLMFIVELIPEFMILNYIVIQYFMHKMIFKKIIGNSKFQEVYKYQN